jgi:nitrite reductase (NADH) small subunit
MTTEWVPVCALDELAPNTGAAALVAGRQVAVVRFGEDAVFALDNYDPFSHAFVIARGIVGDHEGIPKIASPIYKQTFDLRTGQCLDDPAVRLTTYPVRLNAGIVELMIAPK